MQNRALLLKGVLISIQWSKNSKYKIQIEKSYTKNPEKNIKNRAFC